MGIANKGNALRRCSKWALALPIRVMLSGGVVSGPIRVMPDLTAWFRSMVSPLWWASITL